MYPIRKAIDADAQSVFDLRSAAIRSQCAGYYSEEIIARWTEGLVPPMGFCRFVEDDCHVIEMDGRIVVSGALDSTGKIDAVFVCPQKLRQGLATSMMMFLERQALAENLEILHLESTLNAEDFYRSIGFLSDGISQYQSPRGFSMECVVMHKRIKHVV